MNAGHGARNITHTVPLKPTRHQCASVRTLRLREGKWIAPSHTASKCHYPESNGLQGPHSNLGVLKLLCASKSPGLLFKCRHFQWVCMESEIFPSLESSRMIGSKRPLYEYEDWNHSTRWSSFLTKEETMFRDQQQMRSIQCSLKPL